MVVSPQKIFQRRIEDFTCFNCGDCVTGTGYTNHCPSCLWSRHVDINPGDRANPCLGLMKPIGVEQGSTNKIIHKCLKCGKTGKNKTAKNDSEEALAATALVGISHFPSNKKEKMQKLHKKTKKVKKSGDFC